MISQSRQTMITENRTYSTPTLPSVLAMVNPSAEGRHAMARVCSFSGDVIVCGNHCEDTWRRVQTFDVL